jgi:hypothetical protein
MEHCVTELSDDGAAPDRLVTREELRAIIKETVGLTFTHGTMNQLCAPSRGEGPPIEGFIGRRPFYSVQKGIAWARQRLRQQPYVLHPHSRGEKSYG